MTTQSSRAELNKQIYRVIRACRTLAESQNGRSPTIEQISAYLNMGDRDARRYAMAALVGGLIDLDGSAGLIVTVEGHQCYESRGDTYLFIESEIRWIATRRAGITAGGREVDPEREERAVTPTGSSKKGG